MFIRSIFVLLLFAVFTSVTFSGQAQNQKWYATSGGEMIFSLNMFSDQNQDATVIRWSPVFNLQSMLNRDLSEGFGIYTGINFRNVGFIADDPSFTGVRRKFRTYNVGVPLGIKLGNLNRSFLYVGGDIELPFHYKEKEFVNGDKTSKMVAWFSNRVNNFQPAIHVGFQFLSGSNIKLKYYLNKFFDENHIDYVTRYQRFDGNIFYLSFNSLLFQNDEFVFTEIE